MSIFYQRTLTILNGILTQGHFANGYIFHGPLGSFKKLASYAFSRAIQEGSATAEPYLKEYKKTETETNQIDLYHIQSEGKITIDQIRNIQEQVKYGPNQSSHLIVTIENADQLTIGAANAFLKSLEEPPEGVVFILLTDNPTRLLPTIRSRCQSIDFPLLSHDQHLRIIDLFFADEKENLIALGQASKTLLSLALETQWDKHVSLMSFDEILKSSPDQFSSQADKLVKDKAIIPHILLSWCHDILQTKQSLRNKTYYLNAITETFSALHYNVNMKLQLESLFVKLSK